MPVEMRRERDRGEAGAAGEGEALRVAARQERILVVVAVPPDRPDGVDDVARRQAEAGRHHGMAGRTRARSPGSGRQLRPGRSMDRPVDAATTRQGAVRGVDDGVDIQGRDVGDDDLGGVWHRPIVADAVDRPEA